MTRKCHLTLILASVKFVVKLEPMMLEKSLHEAYAVLVVQAVLRRVDLRVMSSGAAVSGLSVTIDTTQELDYGLLVRSVPWHIMHVQRAFLI